jgi:hypothetical protein
MSIEGWIQRWKVAQVFYDWQTLIAGVLALLAGFGTVAATMIIARRQIAASREEADRVIAATRAQTEATVRLEDLRNASEALAFHAMLEAAMARVLTEAAWARSLYPRTFAQTTDDPSVEAYAVRQCITKGAFAELRAACVRRGGSLTGEFFELEREIDSFASQWGTYAFSGAAAMPVPKGKPAGLGHQLTLSRPQRPLCARRPPSEFDGPQRSLKPRSPKRL